METTSVAWLQSNAFSRWLFVHSGGNPRYIRETPLRGHPSEPYFWLAQKPTFLMPSGPGPRRGLSQLFAEAYN